MGAETGKARFQSLETQAGEAAEQMFEPRLRQLGLAIDQIEEQNLEQLQESLQRVNEAIKNPDQFGLVNVSVTADAGVVVTKVTSESHFTFGILPTLLERKLLILRRIRELGGENAKDLLRKLAENGDGADEDVRRSAAEALRQLNLAESVDRHEAEVDRSLLRDQRRLDLRKEKAEVFRTYVARESVASVVGGILLIVLGAAIVVAMFTEVQTTEVVTNAFLLILGYFFGQSVGRSESDRRAPEKGSDAAA